MNSTNHHMKAPVVKAPSQEFPHGSDELSRLLVFPNGAPDPAQWGEGKAPPSTSATTP